MSYLFKKLTDEELEDTKEKLLSAGTYDFEVKRSTRKISQAGNDMAELNLTIWDNEGKVRNIMDWLVFAENKFNIRKIKHFCDSVGITASYEQGELPEDLELLAGKVSIDIDEGQMIPDNKLNGKPKGSRYADRNVVVDYIKSDEEKKTNKTELPFDDDIGF